MEAIFTSLPMLILAAIACREVPSVNFWYGIISWMKVATLPCARWFVRPSVINPL